MITISCTGYDSFSQRYYDDLIARLDLNTLSCSCGCTGKLIYYGVYIRSVKSEHKHIRLRVRRVYCTHCSRTHAIMPSVIVPYSQFLINDHVSVISSYENRSPSLIEIMDNNNCLDENNAAYIIKSYRKHWKRFIDDAKINLFSNDLVDICFSFFSRQFMQIKTIPNLLNYTADNQPLLTTCCHSIKNT